MFSVSKVTALGAAVILSSSALAADPSMTPEQASELYDYIAPTADQEAASGQKPDNAIDNSYVPTEAEARQYLESYNLADYSDRTANTSDQSLAGTWVAVWDIDKVRSNIKAAPLVSPRLISSRLEMVVIRPKGDSYEVGSCHGKGLEQATLKGGKLTTASRSLSVKNNRSMSLSKIVSKNVQLTPMYGMDYERSYDEKATFKARYIKVSDSTAAVGSFSQYWSTANGVIEKNVYCGMIDNLNDGLQRIRMGSDDAMQFVSSGSIDPEVPAALISEPTFKGEGKGYINTEIELCEGAFYFDSTEAANKSFNYYVIDMAKGTMVEGTGTLKLPLK